MKKEKASENIKSSTTLESFGYFIDAFYRMFKIGIYYPTGHVILDQSASKCLQQLREISPSLNSVKVTVSKDKISIQKDIVLEKQAASEELRDLLYQIGIQSIEIQRNISHKELLSLVKSILGWRTKVEATQEIISFDLEVLPPSIKIVQQEFTVSAAAQMSSDGEQEDYANLVQICDALEKQGLSKVEVEQCRGLLENISENKTNQKIESSAFPNATWADVQKLLFKIVTNSYDPTEKRFSPLVQDDINVISSIFKSLERGLADKKTKQVLQLLVSHLTARKKEDDTEKQDNKASHHDKTPKFNKRKSEGIENFSIEMLETFIYQNVVPVKVLRQISVSDNSERLSIYLQLLKDEPQGPFWEKIESKLTTLLTTNLSKREVEIVVAGVRSLADAADNNSFNRILEPILDTIRDHESFNSLDFVVNLWGGMSPTMHLQLWPFVINELLIVGMNGKKQSFYDVTEIASQIHRDGMYHLRPQIEEMDAFKNRNIAETVFRTSFVYSYPLFAFLLQTSLKDILIEKVHKAFIEQPEDPYIEAIAPILNMSVPRHVVLLRIYMEQAHVKPVPLSLRLEAGVIILEYLQKISEEERGQPWLAKTIAATVGLYVEGTKQILQKIIKEKKMGVFYKWPKDCRNAAAKALKDMGSKPLAQRL